MSVYFPLILVILTVASAIIGLLDKYYFEPKRIRALQARPDYEQMSESARHAFTKPPLLADYARSLFIVFLVVLVIRSFVISPFRVPTGSMLPTIQLNDFLLINKFSYGLRLPITNTKILDTGKPQRGDVIVFRFPPYTGVDYIKTVVGLPGDHISYVNKQLIINGKPVSRKLLGTSVEPDNAGLKALYAAQHRAPSTLVKQYQEDIGGHMHDIYDSPIAPATNFKGLVVPAGHYFVMGDNRDNSEDSRYWGFVAEKDLIGRAFMVAFSWDASKHSVRWNRVGHLLP